MERRCRQSSTISLVFARPLHTDMKVCLRTRSETRHLPPTQCSSAGAAPYAAMTRGEQGRAGQGRTVDCSSPPPAPLAEDRLSRSTHPHTHTPLTHRPRVLPAAAARRSQQRETHVTAAWRGERSGDEDKRARRSFVASIVVWRAAVVKRRACPEEERPGPPLGVAFGARTAVGRTCIMTLGLCAGGIAH